MVAFYCLTKRLREGGLVVAGDGWKWSSAQEPIFGQIKFEISKSTQIKFWAGYQIHTPFMYLCRDRWWIECRLTER